MCPYGHWADPSHPVMSIKQGPMKTPTFSGKVAAVTGAASGIGRSLATALARRGCALALSDVDERGLADTAAACIHPGGIKTNIARASKIHDSMVGLGVNLATAPEDAEKMFKLSPDAAAETILKGVAKNARRVLVGADAKGLDLLQRLMPST